MRPPTPVMDRLLAKVKYDSGCWTFTGSTTAGYGYINTLSRTRYRVHRVAYEHLVGPIPADLEVDHLCRNKACCNPLHLELVTHGENVRRALCKPCARLEGHPQCNRGCCRRRRRKTKT